jgi:hypothetical protein
MAMVKASLVPPSNRRARASTENPPTLRQLPFEEISGLAGTRKFNEQVLKYNRTRAIGRKSTLIFAKDLKYVDNLTKVFVDAGVQAKVVTSRTSRTSRQEYIASFARGECPVLITCLALSEGFDAPQVSPNNGSRRLSTADIDRLTASSWQIPPTPGSSIPRW